MPYGGGYYPPGTPGPRTWHAEGSCENDDCPWLAQHGQPYSATGVMETDLGATDLVSGALADIDGICPHCEADMAIDEDYDEGEDY